MVSQLSTYEALCEALDDEYKARATYRAVIAKFGPVLPFANIVQSEQRHIDRLMALFSSRGWTPPADQWDGAVTAPETIAEAYRAGVEAEVENAALYDRLFAMTDDEEVIAVFNALRRASTERHLPAFQRGVDGSQAAYGPGGNGQGRGHGRDQNQNQNQGQGRGYGWGRGQNQSRGGGRCGGGGGRSSAA